MGTNVVGGAWYKNGSVASVSDESGIATYIPESVVLIVGAGAVMSSVGVTANTKWGVAIGIDSV